MAVEQPKPITQNQIREIEKRAKMDTGYAIEKRQIARGPVTGQYALRHGDQIRHQASRVVRAAGEPSVMSQPSSQARIGNQVKRDIAYSIVQHQITTGTYPQGRSAQEANRQQIQHQVNRVVKEMSAAPVYPTAIPPPSISVSPRLPPGYSAPVYQPGVPAYKNPTPAPAIRINVPSPLAPKVIPQAVVIKKILKY
jgi:hypothetical protein